MTLRPVVIPSLVVEIPQMAERDRLAPAVARLPEEPQCFLQVGLRVRELPEPVVGDADVLVGLSQLAGLACPLADREGRAVARERLLQLPTLVVDSGQVIERRGFQP